MSQRSHHGNTPAAWTAVAVSTVGTVVSAVGLLLSPVSMTLFWVGAVIVVLGLPVFAVMTKMGMGEPQA
jgi:hypothetical protein